MKQQAHRWHMIIGTVLIMVLLATGILWLKSSGDEIMRIGMYTITQDHLALYENDCRAEITSYFYNKYQLDPNEEGFWETEMNGEIPKEALKQKAIDKLGYDTMERIKALEYGLSTDITLKSIKKSLQQENQKRQSVSGLSYGPDQYGLMEYISRTQMEARDELKEKLLAGPLQPSEEQLKELYATAEPSLFDKGGRARIGIYMFYGMKMGEYPAVLTEVWHSVETGIAQGRQPTDIIDEINQQFKLKIEYEEVEYDTSELPRDNQEIEWLVEQTRFMALGQSSGVLDYGASQGILKVLDKHDYGKAEYEESVILLRNMWIEKVYPEYIRQSLKEYGYYVK